MLISAFNSAATIAAWQNWFLRMSFSNTPVVLPWPLQIGFELATRALLDPGDQSSVDFSRPAGEPALVSPDSVSWRVFKNPVSLFVGGVTAVIMELAEPRVRTGVWEHTTFRVDPIRRLRRTGLAAMVTVYGARSTAEGMIAGVRRVHDRITGITPSGEAYCANDPELLNWVHGTAAYGFAQAYHAYVKPLSLLERNCYYADGDTAAALYGASGAPASEAELEMLFQAMAGRLERSDIVFEFLAIMRSAPILPLLLRPFQQVLVRAAIDLTPHWMQKILQLDGHGLHRWEAELVRQAGAFADRLVLESSPAVQACRRMWLPAEYLYVNEIGVHQQAAKTHPQSALGGNKTRKASRLKRWSPTG
jgi:uncharacterized protein (DUF2236 family)